MYITERRADRGREIAVVFAFDALGADLPSLVRYDVPADDEASLRAFLDSVAPRTIAEPKLPDASPVRGLLRLVLNAVLYATSADVTPEVRRVTPRRALRTPSHASPPDSDSVFFLPGKIDVRRVRQLQELTRAPDGGALLAGFMVRGHWLFPDLAAAECRTLRPYGNPHLPDATFLLREYYCAEAGL